jgi:hypothetical protein
MSQTNEVLFSISSYLLPQELPVLLSGKAVGDKEERPHLPFRDKKLCS